MIPKHRDSNSSGISKARSCDYVTGYARFTFSTITVSIPKKPSGGPCGPFPLCG
jgi:hypothetical protein